MSWIKDITDPKARKWEEMYRNRWEYGNRVRSTHGVNCTGGCSWQVYVKDGIITWEMQATDYPELEPGIPPYEPRGCQRGITFSWYIYSPLRVKHPYIRGVLAGLWRRAKAAHEDPVAAWASIMENEEARRSFHRARGKGGLRRTNWDEALEIIAASVIYTAKKYGPDRITGFTPIPAMSMISYCSGTRFLQLLGGVVLSFYDWYADFPPASPEVWGEKTDVSESADWYNSKYIVVMGSNLNMTRTPDVHYAAEARNNGAKLVVLSPDCSQVSKYADWWLPVAAGEDGAFWMAVNHVILREFHAERQTPYFTSYLKRYTDCPFLVEIEQKNGSYRAGRFLRANTIEGYKDAENGQWKFLVMDGKSREPRMPLGSVGFRWQEEKGKWNLHMKDGKDGSEIDPMLTFAGEKDRDAVVQLPFTEFVTGKVFKRGVPVRYVRTREGEKAVTAVLDIMMAQMGVGRGLDGDYPRDYNDPDAPYTPAWQEKHTGLSRDTIIRFAREWAQTAERTKGKCMVIVGSGANHWYHANLNYRTAISALVLCGCAGVNGGGLNHYTGQEKVATEASWKSIAFASDWIKKPRLQNAPSFHYVHTDQWRYDVPEREFELLGSGNSMDMQVNAVRMGWLPFYPQFNRNPIELVHEARQSGAKSERDIIAHITGMLKNRQLHFPVEDPDAPENWPRVFFIWRGNALHTSAKGNEYFLRHYLGTSSNAISPESTGAVEAKHAGAAPEGKLDLVIDLNFRMDTSALYSDIILPSASWYEKDDVNTTDLHSYIHPLSAAVPPCWESRNDWDIFKDLAKKVSGLAEKHMPGQFEDILASAITHDTPQEIAQPEVKNWHKGECEPIAGKTMPAMTIVERDYENLYNRFISFGHAELKEGVSERAAHWEIEDLYHEYMKGAPSLSWGGRQYISLEEMREAANVLLFFAPEANGEIAYRGFKSLEEKTGLEKLADLAEASRPVRYTFEDLLAQPRRILTSPVWTGITNGGRPYSAFCINVERLVPWRTLTGRQHFYLDHRGYLEYGESLPTYKSRIGLEQAGDIVKTPHDGGLVVNYISPHGKWHIHSTYYDNLLMLTLSRGAEPFWLNLDDARKIGVKDNDWVEVYNDNGVIVTRAVVSARVPKGVGIFYHAPERTVYFAKSPQRGMKRGGGTNAVTRIRLKPVLMVGGYAHLSFAFNAYGPPSADRDTYAVVKKLEGRPVF
ncbi:MAG: nitrate reductase subunit alpha [Nitrospiraceae bacterium]|nr:nitrate reductase subunit alpha [Nitrospiraceae bacterium]